MASKHAISLFLLAYSLAAVHLVRAQTLTDGARKERGWQVYQAAREAAGMGPSAGPIHDYTFELRTRTKTPQGEVNLRSKGYFVSPNLVRQEIEAPSGKIVMVFDGTKGWRALADGNRDLPSAIVDQYRADLSRSHVLLSPPVQPDTVWFLRQEEVEGRSADVIELRQVEGAPLRLFVDTDTRDVVKKMFVGDSPSGMARVEEFYSDFREVDGYRWPHRKRVLRNGNETLESSISDIRFNAGLTKSDILQ